eukprot:Skav210940  [mRNA]  locus=scaffold713:149324:150597:- [translate_table: standard]
MNISEDGQLLAWTNLDSVHGLLRLQLCNDIQNQEIGVLLWKQTSGLLELHQPLQPGIIDVRRLRVAGPVVAGCRLWHSHGSLALLH